MNSGKSSYVLSGSILTLVSTGVEIRFPWPVGDVLEFNYVFVVLLEPEVGVCFNENVFGVTSSGSVAWVIEKRQHVYDDSPYTSILKEGDLVRLLNWDGEELIVDPNSGLVLSVEYGK